MDATEARKKRCKAHYVAGKESRLRRSRRTSVYFILAASWRMKFRETRAQYNRIIFFPQTSYSNCKRYSYLHSERMWTKNKRKESTPASPRSILKNPPRRPRLELLNFEGEFAIRSILEPFGNLIKPFPERMPAACA